MAKLRATTRGSCRELAWLHRSVLQHFTVVEYVIPMMEPFRVLSQKELSTQPEFFREIVFVEVRSGRVEDRLVSVNVKCARSILGKISPANL